VKEAGETLDSDLSSCSFERFVAFAFDRPVSVEPGGGWWWDDTPRLIVDPELFFAEPLRNTDLELGPRLDCVRAMFVLYDKLFSSMKSGTAAEMWWELLSDGPPDEPLRLEMVKTLARMLDAGCAKKLHSTD
jgi:hypothetical protein